MSSEGKLDRRHFLKSAAVGVTSLAAGGTACGENVESGSDLGANAGSGGFTRASRGGDDSGGSGRSFAGTGGDAARDSGMGEPTDAPRDSGTGEPADAPTSVSWREAGRRPPNVLFVLADQWRAQSMGYAGDSNAKTPNLDRLARESIAFSHAVSCTPVCCPYRATLLTGRYPTDHGVFLNDVNLAPDPNSLAERFKRVGYDTGYIGKWHLDGQGCRVAYTPPERRQGFSRWAAIECTHDYNNSVYYAGNDGSTRRTWQGYDAIAQTRELQRWLRERDPEKPFFYVLSWGPPHEPYDTAPSEFASMFSPDAIQVRPNVPSSYQAEAQLSLAGYYAHMAALDACVGDLLETLDELGIADDTIVVFTSDHGDMHRSQGELWKEQPWDEAILVPFLLRYPAGLGRAGRTIPMRLSTPDIMPTLLGLAEIEPPPSLPGYDLSPILRREQAPNDNTALIMCVSPFAIWKRSVGGKEYRGVRTGRFTYVEDLAGPWLLYDDDLDPYQLNNLVNRPDHSMIQADLKSELAAKLAAIGDQFHPGPWYIERWGYTVGDDGAVPYTYDC